VTLGREPDVSHAVRRLLEPRSIAVVGASARAGGFGERMVGELLRSTADLEIHFVNPGYREIAGRACVASLADVPGPVDLVLLGVRDEALEAELTTATERGDGAAVIFGNAYEPPSPDGAPGLRERLATIAAKAGMALCGGGCMGFVNVVRGVRAVGYIEPDPVPVGPVALLSHSGSVFSALLRSGRGGGFSLAVSSGQELVTAAPAYLDYAMSLPGTGVLALVMEAVREAPVLRRSLALAAERDLPVVLLPVGVSSSGAAMVAAHSGAVAGGRAAWEALADRYGVHLVADLAELMDTVEMLGLARRRWARPAPGGGVAAVLDSGAERALIVDVAERLAVPFAALAPETTAALDARVDPGLVVANPLDVWGNGADTESLLTDALTTLAADPEVRAVALAVDLVEEFDGDESYRDAAVAAAAAAPVPVAVLSHVPSAVDRSAAARLRAAGVPVLEGTVSGLVALRHFLARSAPPPVVDEPIVDLARQARWGARLQAGPVDAALAFEFLADHDIAVPEVLPADDERSVLAAAALVGFPVVLKTGEPIAHKSDVGGVRVGLGDEAAVREAYRGMSASLGPRVVVCRQVPAGVEALVGLVADPALGPVVVVGAGGVLVEQFDDRVAFLPPVTVAEAVAGIGRLRLARLLTTARGGSPPGVEGLAAVVSAVSGIAVELGDQLAALEINPVIATPGGAIAVDVLIEPR